MYLDGDREWPTLVGTGTEDYVGGGWALNQFSNLYQRAPYSDPVKMLYSLYRFHVPDPVYFQSGNPCHDPTDGNHSGAKS